MDRSHATFCMRQGALKLAIPTAVFDDLVHQAKKQSFEEHSHDRSRVEPLVWNHICEQKLQDADLYLN
jgi:hypothetical protein